MSAPYIYNHDTSQLCRTGHDDVSGTRMTTLIFILLSYFPLMISDAILCPLHNLKTVWNIVMILYGCVEQVMTMCCIQEWQLSLSYFLSYFPLDHFRCNLVFALLLECPFEFNHDTSQLCRTGHDDVLHTRMTTLAFILSELFPLDDFRCNFVHAP